MFHWMARYKNGAVVKQYNSDGLQVSSDSIDRDQLERFILLNDNKPIVILHLDDGQKLIYRRRVELVEGQSEIACHIVGWRKKIGEEITQSILFVFEDGHIEAIGDFQENHRWFYQPTLREFELPCH